MSWAVVAASLWVLAGAATAMLPMRWQMWPGGALLLSAPVLLVWLGVDHGVWVALAALLAVLSMFRRPLRHLLGKIFGKGGSA